MFGPNLAMRAGQMNRQRQSTNYVKPIAKSDPVEHMKERAMRTVPRGAVVDPEPPKRMKSEDLMKRDVADIKWLMSQCRAFRRGTARYLTPRISLGDATYSMHEFFPGGDCSSDDEFQVDVPEAEAEH